jgi:hypothetical protein
MPEPRRTLLHEIWEDFGDAGESLPCLCLAGPLGEGCRQSLGPRARLMTTFEAASHFEAMTTYYEIMGWGKYTTDQEWDVQPYPEDWFSR